MKKSFCLYIALIGLSIVFVGCRAYSRIWGYPIEPKIEVKKSSFTKELSISSSWTYVTFTDNKYKTRLHKFVYDNALDEVFLHLDWNSYDEYCVEKGNTIDFYTKSGKIHTLYSVYDDCAEPIIEVDSTGYMRTRGYSIYLIYEGDFDFLETDDYIEEVRIQSASRHYYEDKIKGAQANTMNKAYQKIMEAIEDSRSNLYE